MKNLVVLGLLLSGVSFAQSPGDVGNGYITGITKAEKKHACEAIINLLDYDDGIHTSLCLSGEWIISDVEMGRGNRQVAFLWRGKVSKSQSNNDDCTGYVLTQPSGRKKTTKVINLSCE